jgi:hypothetical protein
LWLWTRAFGTGDAALRALSLVCALACVPWLLALARWAGGKNAVLPAGVLFAFLPVSIYYGTEGRMYALLWFFVLGLVAASVRVRSRGWSSLAGLGWILCALGGFLTHYFFAFPWCATTLVLLWTPGRTRRLGTFLAVGLLGLLASPWYAGVPEGLERWRITQGWLAEEPTGFSRASAAWELFLGTFSGSAPDLWGEHRAARLAALGLFLLLALTLAARGRGARGQHKRVLLWAWLLAAWSGPLWFDALLGTHTVAVSRYALAGMPAAVLLASSALSTWQPLWRHLWLAGIVVAWTPHLRLVYGRATRSWCPLRETARALEGNSNGSDLLLVQSIPSGLLGVARYYDGEAPLAAWVEQLGQRDVPASLLGLARGRARIHFVRLHDVGASDRLPTWLEGHALRAPGAQRDPAWMASYRPRTGSTF